MLILDFEWL